jgi:hypothetical protein
MSTHTTTDHHHHIVVKSNLLLLLHLFLFLWAKQKGRDQTIQSPDAHTKWKFDFHALYVSDILTSRG